jgi:hypothetical protein
LSGPTFPPLPARSLAGEDFLLPGDLPAVRTAVIVAFHQRHQQAVDDWIDALVREGVPPTPRHLPPDSRAAVIEIPMLKRRWAPARPFIDGGMAAGIAAADITARTWTCYTDVDAFLSAMGTSGGQQVLAAVVQRDGTVLVQERGLPTDAGVARIRSALVG